jgi:hypothetical protein
MTNREQIIKNIVEATNIDVFCSKYVKLKHPSIGLIDFNLYPWQSNFLKQTDTTCLNALVKSRQIGASALEEALTLHSSLFCRDHSTVFVGSRSDNGATFLEKVLWKYDNLPSFLKELNPITRTEKRRISFKNGSSIRTTHSDAIPDVCGESNSLVIFDEAEWITNLKEIYMALAPTIHGFKRGRILMVSTPNPLQPNSQFRQLISSSKPFRCSLADVNWSLYEKLQKLAAPEYFKAEVLGLFEDETITDPRVILHQEMTAYVGKIRSL